MVKYVSNHYAVHVKLIQNNTEGKKKKTSKLLQGVMKATGGQIIKYRIWRTQIINCVALRLSNESATGRGREHHGSHGEPGGRAKGKRGVGVQFRGMHMGSPPWVWSNSQWVVKWTGTLV